MTKYADTFESENIKRKEKLCTIGFVLSIIGLMLSSLGITFGLIIYLLNLCFAFQGLKTSKRPMAIGTIVLSILSIAITVLWIVMFV